MLDGSGSLSTGSLKLMASSFSPRLKVSSSWNSDLVSTFLAALMNVSAGGTGFIETKPATLSGWAWAYMNTMFPPADWPTRKYGARTSAAAANASRSATRSLTGRGVLVGRVAAADPGAVERAHDCPPGELL